MFNVRPGALIPWLHVEPPPADEVPGFRMNPDGSARDTQREAASGSFGFGIPPGTLTARYADAVQALAQPILRVPTPGPELLAQSTLPTGLAGFRARPGDNVPGFNLRLENALPGFNLLGSGSDAQRQETSWFDGTRPESAVPPYSDTAPTLTPPSVKDWAQLVPPQLSEWLYKLVTMPVPQLSTAFDPRTGRRIVPYEPLIGLVRSYLTTDENSRGTEDIHPYVDGIGPLPDLDFAEAPSAEQWPSSDTPAWPADINSGPGATTAQHANPEPTPEATIGKAWPQQPPMDGWPYAEAGGAEREVPRSAVMIPQPVGVAPSLSAGSVADSNFILANAGDAEEPQAEQRTPLPQDQPTELKNQVTATGLASRPPEHRTEQALSRFIEQYERTTTDLVEDLTSAIARFGERFYHDSILKPGDDLARLAARFADDPVKTTLSVLNSFPQTPIEGEFLASFAAVFTILANARRGLAFEKDVLDALNAARLTPTISKNASKIGVEGLGRSVPDILLKGITEIKSGVEINNSVQLKVQAAYAKATRVPFSLIVSPTTQRISQEVKEAVRKAGGTIQRFDPATGAFTPFQ